MCPGQHPGVDQRAQRGAVRGTAEVVLDGCGDERRLQRIAEIGKQLSQLVGRQQVEEHEDIGLFGGLVGVDRTSLSLQDPVEALDVAVPLSVGLPVELLKVLVALELADDTVMERDEHLVDHLLPEPHLAATQPQALGELHPPAHGQGLEHVKGTAKHPHRHDVRVGVVVHARILGPRVPGVKLVGPHHPPDDEAIQVGIKGRQGGPVAGDVKDHLGSLLLEEAEVAAGLVVVPGRERHRQTRMSLQPADVRQPSPRQRVEVNQLAHLATVAAGLPGVERAAQATGPRGRAGGRQAAIPVAQQRARQTRGSQGQHRQHKEFVPEDMPAVGLTMQPPGRHAGICLQRVGGQCLQKVEEVEPDGQGRLRTALVFLLQRGVETLPQLGPGQRVPIEQVVEVSRVLQVRDHCLGRLGQRPVASGVQRDHLLQRHRLTSGDGYGHLLLNQTRLGTHLPLDLTALPRTTDPSPGCDGDPDPRLARLDRQHHGVGTGEPLIAGQEVIAGQFPVAVHAGILHGAVNARANAQHSRPVLGDDRGLQTGQMRLRHVDEPPLGQPREPSARVTEAKPPGQQSAPQVQLLALGQHLHLVKVEPVTVIDRDRDRKPVGQVHHGLVVHALPGDLVSQPVPAAGDVGARVVNPVCARLGCRPAGGEVPVTKGAQGLTQPFVYRVEPLVGQDPFTHSRGPSIAEEATPSPARSATMTFAPWSSSSCP